jgi:hypothetical protein
VDLTGDSATECATPIAHGNVGFVAVWHSHMARASGALNRWAVPPTTRVRRPLPSEQRDSAACGEASLSNSKSQPLVAARPQAMLGNYDL